MTEKPNIVTDEHLVFLDKLMEYGVTNSFGGRRYVEQEFDLAEDQAKKNRHLLETAIQRETPRNRTLPALYEA